MSTEARHSEGLSHSITSIACNSRANRLQVSLVTAPALAAAAFLLIPSLSAQTAPAARPAAPAKTAPAKAVPAKTAPAAAAAKAAPVITLPAAESKVPAEPIFLILGNDSCEINDPFSKAPLNGAKWTIRGSTLVRNERVPGSTGYMLVTRKLADVTQIQWPTPPKQMEDAVIAYQRGDAQTSLRIIQDVLNFFEKMKKNTPGSLWLKAASIKLDALIVLQNDALLANFIRELEAVDSSAIPSLPDRISLAKLSRTARTSPQAAISEADELIKKTTAPEILAQAHLIKGNAQLTLRQPEEAMKTFLRINVFYGNPPSYIPAAQLGAAKAFRAMNAPNKREQKLDEVANHYLRDIIKEYPNTKEAILAKEMLPKDERDAAAAAAAEQEKAVAAATSKEADPENTLPPPTEKAPAKTTPSNDAATSPAAETQNTETASTGSAE